MIVPMGIVVVILLSSSYAKFSHALLMIKSGRIRSSSRIHLFRGAQTQYDVKPRNEQQHRWSSGGSFFRIPTAKLDFIRNGFGDQVDLSPPFPYPIDMMMPPTTDNKRDNDWPDRLILRHLEDEDIISILPEIVREFGSLSIPTTNTPEQPGNALSTKIENFLFSLTVLIGLTQRVERRKKGYLSADARPDHNVVCLVERIPKDRSNRSDNDDGKTTILYTEQIVGIAELSFQPPNPSVNAPPFVLPYFVKQLICNIGGADPVGYVSNVLVWKTRRGRGYSHVLMAALEGIAKLWQCNDIRLHVDAGEHSGRIARDLYWNLGYDGVPDRGTTRKDGTVGYEWMGPCLAHQGLYLVDGVPLLYLRKSLKQ